MKAGGRRVVRSPVPQYMCDYLYWGSTTMRWGGCDRISRAWEHVAGSAGCFLHVASHSAWCKIADARRMVDMGMACDAWVAGLALTCSWDVGGRDGMKFAVLTKLHLGLFVHLELALGDPSAIRGIATPTTTRL